MRAIPPPEIEPLEFFERWLERAVAADPERRARLSKLDARIQFDLAGREGGSFYLELRGGRVRGGGGRLESPDLRLWLEVETWRRLNAGKLSAPMAAARGLLRFEGNLYLALRLHFLLS
ncbi:MAG: SCP2 sterol-binding domain-containing protein [Myxococcota bacterium]